MTADALRILHFGDADLDQLYNLDDTGPDGALWIDATGTVEMPASARLLLANRSSPFDLSPLAGFAPDDLWELDLEYSDVQDEDLRHIAHLTGLRVLDLSLTGITEAAIPHLEGLHGLRRLGLYECEISRDGVRRLRQALPLCALTGLPEVTVLHVPPPEQRDQPAWHEGSECPHCGKGKWVYDRIDYNWGEKMVLLQCTACGQEMGAAYSSVRWVADER